MRKPRRSRDGIPINVMAEFMGDSSGERREGE